MAYIVFGGLHAERHDGTVAERVVGLPIVFVGSAALVVVGMGVAHGDVADERDGGNAVELGIVPNGIVAAVGGLLIGGHLAESIGGTHSEVIVFIPISARARTDVGVGGFRVGANHGFAKAGAVDSPVGSVAAVAHGEEGHTLVGEVVHVADGELRVCPAGVGAMGSVVDETDARV